MPVDTAAGAKFYIGPANSSAASQSDYEALTYVEVGEVESIGDFGDAYNEVNFTALSDRRVRKFKGSKNAGNLQLTIGHDSADSGQQDLDDASETDNDYAFKVELDDGTTSDTTFFFRGKVMSVVNNPGNAENIVRVNAVIGINSDILKIDAT